MAGTQIKTNVNLLAKVTSLGASFFQKFVTSVSMNKSITNMNNVGLRSMVIATAADAITDFAFLEVGDYVGGFDTTAGATYVRFGTVVTAGTLPFAAIAGHLYIQITPTW